MSSETRSTTNLDIDRVKQLCGPIFEAIHSRHPSFVWAGVFGSVSRGTQKPDSDVDIVVGYTRDAKFFRDVCDDMTVLERLPETLGVEVDVVAFIEHAQTFRYIDMEALLTAKTIWGDESWLEATRATAMYLLKDGYARMKRGEEMMSHVRKTLLSIQGELMSPEHEALRLCVLQEVLSVIRLVKVPRDPFYVALQQMMPMFLDAEETIQAYLQGDSVDQQILEGMWVSISNVNTFSLRAMKQSAEETFRYAGLVPSGLPQKP